MLNGQYLPWRMALRIDRRLGIRELNLAGRAYATYRRRRIPILASSLTVPRSSNLTSSPTLSSSFSTSTPRRKDSQKDSPDFFVENVPETEQSKEDTVPAAEAEKKQTAALSKAPKSESPSGGKIPGGTGDGKGSSATSGGSGSGPGSGDGGGGGGGKKARKSGLPQKAQDDKLPPSTHLAVGIGGRPLFPGWQKAITIRDPNLIKSIALNTEAGNMHFGAFLFKDPNARGDVIENREDVYEVGVLAQVTNILLSPGDPNVMTALIHPHRRIRMSGLVGPKGMVQKSTERKGENKDDVPDVIPPPAAGSKEEAGEKTGDIVASFHEEGMVQQKQAKGQVASPEPLSHLGDLPVSCAIVEHIKEEVIPRTNELKAYSEEILNTMSQIAHRNHHFRDQVATFLGSSASPAQLSQNPQNLAYLAASVSDIPGSGIKVKELQAILEEMDAQKRLEKALNLLKEELMTAQTQMKIKEGVEGEIMKRQREYYLMQQMKGIRKELGIESDGKDKLVEKFKEKASKLAMPEAVKRVFDEEMNKLAHLEPAASEFNVTRNYLDWLTQIPWGQRSAENFGIENAKTVLNEDHYGLKDVKDRILEFIAVGKLRGTVEGKILCFVGPPGVGKTSIGKSIARALNRQYYRFSVGGLWDVAEIKGHRRTYVGALPGRIIQALKKCQTENPLILIDEIDKVGRGNQGDPSSALLELLDPEQNNSFLDHYLDVPVDLSKVLFVCTANMTDTVPRPLLDRMEMIELSGYVADEKMAIADKYLGPAAKELAGLKDVDVNLSKEAIEELIKSYCRESGVRNLKKQIEKVYRKSALKIVQDLGEETLPEAEALTEQGKEALEESKKDETDVKTTPEDMDKQTTEQPRIGLKVPDTLHITIDKDNLKDYVGPPKYTSDRLYETTPAGVAMGLAWTQMGGAALYVESILESTLTHSSRPGLEITGNLRSVMKESTSIAYSFAKSLMVKSFPDNRFFDRARVHLHCPEGAIQKDGPSAGITMATSLLSLALEHPLDPTIAMTGELTVTGKVLRIGGLREKTVAARRAGSKSIIFPKDNMSNWLELPDVSVSLHRCSLEEATNSGNRISKKALKVIQSSGIQTYIRSSSKTWMRSSQTTSYGRSNSRSQRRRMSRPKLQRRESRSGKMTRKVRKMMIEQPL